MMYNIASIQLEQDDTEDSRAATFKKMAFETFGAGAQIGSRGCIKLYLQMLKEDAENNAAEIEEYSNIARALDLQLED